MTISINKNQEKLTIIPEGVIDKLTAPEFLKAVNDNIEGIKELVIDMEKLEYISSSGFKVLLTIYKKMTKIGKMKLIHVEDMVMDMLNFTGFVDVLTIE